MGPQAEANIVVRAAFRLLGGFVRLFGERLTCTVAEQLLREAYIADARRVMGTPPGQKAMATHVAYITGLPVRVIRGIEADRPSDTSSFGDIWTTARILDAWSTDPEYLDPGTGEPLAIPVTGPAPSLAALATRLVGRNVSPNAALHYLKLGDHIETDGAGLVRLIDPVYSIGPHDLVGEIARTSDAVAGILESAESMFHTPCDGDRWPISREWSAEICSSQLPALRKDVREAFDSSPSPSNPIARAAASGWGRAASPPGGRPAIAGVTLFYWERP